MALKRLIFSSFLVCLQYFTCTIEYVPNNRFIKRFRQLLMFLLDLAVLLFSIVLM